MTQKVIFKYVSDGASLLGIPARDMDEEEAKQYDVKWMLSSGLYIRVPVPTEIDKSEVKDGTRD